MQDQGLEVGYQPRAFWIGRFDGDQHVTERYNSTFFQCTDAQRQFATVNFHDAFPAFVVEHVWANVTIDEFLRTIDVTHGHRLHQEFLDDGRETPVYCHGKIVIGTTGFNVRVAIATEIGQLTPLSGFVAIAVDWQYLCQKVGFQVLEAGHKEILFTFDWRKSLFRQVMKRLGGLVLSQRIPRTWQ
ncbi:hypothetical protein D3C75_917580 [compost metagenome]